MTEPVEQHPPLTALTRRQRRVLGTLVEKGLTVPASYPLTLNALVTGCNQKNNRSPITNYDDGDVAEAIEELGNLGLAAVVHTESGRTERYRHYLRRRLTLTEPQVAILTELLLRGRQQAGELRARAARMAPERSLDSLEQLRAELAGLIEMKLVQAHGSLESRGVEVDHNLYEPGEPRPAAGQVADDAAAPHASGSRVPATDLEARVHALAAECAALRDELGVLRGQMQDLAKQMSELKLALGVA
jgi:hypothetical protein